LVLVSLFLAEHEQVRENIVGDVLAHA
jgi:hypothetical protein